MVTTLLDWCYFTVTGCWKMTVIDVDCGRRAFDLRSLLQIVLIPGAVTWGPGAFLCYHVRWNLAGLLCQNTLHTHTTANGTAFGVIYFKPLSPELMLSPHLCTKLCFKVGIATWVLTPAHAQGHASATPVCISGGFIGLHDGMSPLFLTPPCDRG